MAATAVRASVAGERKNLSRAGWVANRSRTATLVPCAPPYGSRSRRAPTSKRSSTPEAVAEVRDAISTRPAAAMMLGSASPRKPSVRMARRSSELASLLVAWRLHAVSISSGGIPQPLSTTRIRSRPPRWSSTTMARAPASIAFSTNSLTTEAGRSTTSPAAICAATSGGSKVIGIGYGSICAAFAISVPSTARHAVDAPVFMSNVRRAHRFNQFVEIERLAHDLVRWCGAHDRFQRCFVGRGENDAAAAERARVFDFLKVAPYLCVRQADIPDDDVDVVARDVRGQFGLTGARRHFVLRHDVEPVLGENEGDDLDHLFAVVDHEHGGPAVTCRRRGCAVHRLPLCCVMTSLPTGLYACKVFKSCALFRATRTAAAAHRAASARRHRARPVRR